MARLSVELAGLLLRNPVMSASGTFGHGLEMRHFAPPESLGGLVSKTVTLNPRPGNPAPRICETEAGLLNSIGLENKGIEAYQKATLPEMLTADTCVVTNIGGESIEEFGVLARRLDDEQAIDLLEVNLSCPNVGGGRLPFSTDPKMAERAIAEVRANTTKPILAKLSPNVTDIGEIAKGAAAGGADGITAVNTLLGMSVNWRNGQPGLATLQGGYSGVGIKPVALRAAWTCSKAVDLPIVGCGGIRNAEDILQFLAVGCTAVQVGTSSFSDPSKIAELPGELSALLDAEKLESIVEVIGSLQDGRPKRSLCAESTGSAN